MVRMWMGNNGQINLFSISSILIHPLLVSNFQISICLLEKINHRIVAPLMKKIDQCVRCAPHGKGNRSIIALLMKKLSNASLRCS